MKTTQTPLPSTAFCSDCGRRINLAHKPGCPAAIKQASPIEIKRVGARVTCTRASGTTILRFRIVSVAKKVEQAIRQDPRKLDECIAMMQAGVWS